MTFNSNNMTAELAGRIKRLRLMKPDWPQHRIAAYFDLNQGRVSEVLNQKRFSSQPPSEPWGM